MLFAANLMELFQIEDVHVCVCHAARGRRGEARVMEALKPPDVRRIGNQSVTRSAVWKWQVVPGVPLIRVCSKITSAL